MNPEQEQLSETERHWNQICLTSVTIATAVMAAAFLISGLDEGRPNPVFAVNLAKLICAGGTGLEYGALMLLSGRAIFPPVDRPTREKEAWKLVHARYMIGMLWAMIFTVILMVLAIIAIPPDLMLISQD